MMRFFQWIKKKNEDAIHLNMSIVGGFLGAYTILVWHNFGLAQTANLIQMLGDVFSGDWKDAIFRVMSLFVFCFGLILANILPRYICGNVRKICIWIEIVGVIISGLIPEKVHPIVALLPMFFITAFQWGVFCGNGKYSCSSTFSTNNLRQMIVGWTEYLHTKNAEQKEKVWFYTRTLICYHIGVVAGCAAVFFWNTYAVYVCLVPLLAGLWIIRYRII